jgi:hypothetical protein
MDLEKCESEGRRKTPGTSEQSALGEADVLGAGHDEVIEHADINQCEGFDQPAGDLTICSRRFALTTRVVVRVMCPFSLCDPRCKSA